jgi:hypothetical protein
VGRHPAAGHRAPDRARAAAALTGRGEPPGEVGGQPITAAHLRALLTDLDALGLRAPAGGSLDLALTDPDGTLRAT